MFKLTLFLALCIYATNAILQPPSVVYTPPSPEPNSRPYVNPREESARKFLQQYNSYNPVVLLIDDTQRSNNEAFNFFKNVNRLSRKVDNINFILMKFNSSGASETLEATKNNKHRFEEILKSGVSEYSKNFLGYQNVSTGAVFFGLLNAVQALPPNSGVVIFMEREIEDETLAQHALVEVLKKRIQVYVVWLGKNEEYLLKELAMRSRGVFVVVSDRDPSEAYYEKFLEDIESLQSVSLILSRKNLHGSHNLNFPIDSDVTGIHITITPNVTLGVLSTPRGVNMDLLGDQDVSQFSLGSFINRENGVHEIHLNTTRTTTRDVGIWRLNVDNARAGYNVEIFVHTKLTTKAEVTGQNPIGGSRKVLKLGITGDVSSVKNITFVDENGKQILSNVKFTPEKDWENYLTENIDETNKTNEININVEKVPKGSFYAVVDGKDSRGKDFRRLSYVKNNDHKEFYLPPLTVEVGLGSELITEPLRQPQLFFEVTNNGHQPTLVRFLSRDEKSLLLNMNPWYRWISPQETATVRVTLTTRPGSYQDLITFTAQGSETVSKKVIVDVGLRRDDTRDPVLHYQYTSDCTDVLLGSCEDGTWTVEVKAKDTGSGLLQVTSEPKGIYFPHGFTTGTTEEVTGYYSESCCNPDLKLVAFDRQNNKETRHLNAYRANLSPGAIAAIVLGILLLLLIIIAIAVACWRKKWCVCCTKTTGYDLPVYRGPLSARTT